MDKKIAVIGTGNMGKAIIQGLVSHSNDSLNSITASTRTDQEAQNIQEEFGINLFTNNQLAAKNSDIIILAVKPYLLEEVITEIIPIISQHTLIISIAAGFTIGQAEELLGGNQPFIRAMPNLAAQVGESMTGIVENSSCSDTDINDAITIFNAIGRTEMVTEDLLHAVIGVSGSSPTLVFMLIQAMADSGVANGLTREQSLKLATQMVKGCATYLEQSDTHPEKLKDNVCTPGGTSIQMVLEAEKQNYRHTIQSAIQAGIDKSKELSK